jgi:hypothetical protein
MTTLKVRSKLVLTFFYASDLRRIQFNFRIIKTMDFISIFPSKKHIFLTNSVKFAALKTNRK